MWLSGMSDHSASSLVFPVGQRYKVPMNAHCYKSSWYDVTFCKDIKPQQPPCRRDAGVNARLATLYPVTSRGPAGLTPRRCVGWGGDSHTCTTCTGPSQSAWLRGLTSRTPRMRRAVISAAWRMCGGGGCRTVCCLHMWVEVTMWNNG